MVERGMEGVEGKQKKGLVGGREEFLLARYCNQKETLLPIVFPVPFLSATFPPPARFGARALGFTGPSTTTPCTSGHLVGL